jgi:hypothetical protein
MEERQVEIDPRAVAIQLVRVDRKRDEFCYYEAITFPKDPNGGCSLWIRRAAYFGMVSDEPTDYIADLLSDPDTNIQEVHLTERGFRYLRDRLRPHREYV